MHVHCCDCRFSAVTCQRIHGLNRNRVVVEICHRGVWAPPLNVQALTTTLDRPVPLFFPELELCLVCTGLPSPRSLHDGPVFTRRVCAMSQTPVDPRIKRRASSHSPHVDRFPKNEVKSPGPAAYVMLGAHRRYFDTVMNDARDTHHQVPR